MPEKCLILKGKYFMQREMKITKMRAIQLRPKNAVNGTSVPIQSNAKASLQNCSKHYLQEDI